MMNIIGKGTKKFYVGLTTGIVLSGLLFSSCTPESTKLEPIQQSEGFHLTMSGTLSRSAQTDAVLNRMRLYSFTSTGTTVSGEGGSGQSPYSHPVAGVTRSGMTLSTTQMRTGNWDLVLVSDGGATLTPPIASVKAEELLMYTYEPTPSATGTPPSAHEVWHRMKRLPTIVTDGNHTDACGISRNMAMVRVVVERAVDVNTAATDHTVTLHHVPNRLSWAGTLLRTTSPGVYATSLSAPDTLAAPIRGKIAFTPATETGTFRSDTLTFVIPAHRENDFWADATTQNMNVRDTLTHKMSLSVSFAKASGGYFTRHVQLPVVAKCNQVLLLKLRIDHFNIELTPTVLPWETQTVGGDAVVPYLNVSQLSTTLYDAAVSRIYFWSNQPADSVYVARVGQLGGAALANVDTQLDRLVGATAVNRHYDAATQSGYIDIANRNIVAGQQDIKIYLNAGALQREITVKRTASAQVLQHITIPYVGTFHRWNETGERVVTWDYTGAWTAYIDDPSGTEVDVLIDRQPSPAMFDGSLYGASPLNPELCKVSEGARSVTGMNRVYFRVGWKDSATSPAEPRYATITVRQGVNNAAGTVIRTLYLRQGEAADYVMRPNDRNSSGATVADNRSYARKFSPYNLTAAAMTEAAPYYVTLTPRGGSFVSYPTQVGAFFQWAGSAGRERRAYHPTTTATVDWANSWATDFWSSLAATHETCPTGYRRFNDGSTSAASLGVVDASELRQSIFLNPPPGGGDVAANSLWGFYADGFFDRREVNNAAGALGAANAAVLPNSKEVGYIGRLYFNPSTKASLFFPAGGRLLSNVGTIDQAGVFGLYSSSSTLDNATDRWSRNLYILTNGSSMPEHWRSWGTTTRCVAE